MGNIFDYIHSFFLAVVWISEWPRQKQTALMISNPLCAISFVWCFVSFPFFMHLHKSSTFIRVERIARKKSWRRPSVHGDRLNPSYFILCVCSMMFNFRFWSFHPFDTVYGQESRRAHHKTTKWLCWWKPRVPHTLDGVGLVPEWMCTYFDMKSLANPKTSTAHIRDISRGNSLIYLDVHVHEHERFPTKWGNLDNEKDSGRVSNQKHIKCAEKKLHMEAQYQQIIMGSLHCFGSARFVYVCFTIRWLPC